MEGLGNRSYLAGGARAAVVVDPPRDVDHVIAAAARRGVRIEAVAETHVHNDYVTGGLELARLTGARYLVPAGASVAYERVPVVDGDVEDVDEGLTLRAVATLGHTPHHTSYVLEEDGHAVTAFTGGSLLIGSVGRPDTLLHIPLRESYRGGEPPIERHCFVTTPSALSPDQAADRLGEFTVIDVRSPVEYATGHLPGAHNVPLDRLDEAVEALKTAAAHAPLLVVCASGARSAKGCAQLAGRGIEAATLEGGTNSWAAAGYDVDRPAGSPATWPMDRQVRLAAGSLVVVGFLAGFAWQPAHWLSAAVGAGLVFSGVTNTCGMAAVLSKLPHNRPPKNALSFQETLLRLTA